MARHRLRPEAWGSSNARESTATWPSIDGCGTESTPRPNDFGEESFGEPYCQWETGDDSEDNNLYTGRILKSNRLDTITESPRKRGHSRARAGTLMVRPCRV